jgi:hypothetical protein
VSHIEKGELASTRIHILEACVEALGGQLRIEAAVGDSRVRLR